MWFCHLFLHSTGESEPRDQNKPKITKTKYKENITGHYVQNIQKINRLRGAKENIQKI